SPVDLQTLRSTCRVFQQVIDSVQRNSIWRYAFRNVLLPPPFNTLYLPSRITALVFGGGKCYVCPRLSPHCAGSHL
ncbi:hypothetical protein K438DRAFT_1812616, partial [Mycena galopus ATCC 62051]